MPGPTWVAVMPLMLLMLVVKAAATLPASRVAPETVSGVLCVLVVPLMVTL